MSKCVFIVTAYLQQIGTEKQQLQSIRRSQRLQTHPYPYHRHPPPHAPRAAHTHTHTRKMETKCASTLISEISNLCQKLSQANAEHTQASTQLSSLQYAAELTRSEIRRRQRSNAELHNAYKEEEEEEEREVADDAWKATRGLERELLNAKRDVGNVMYEVESARMQKKGIFGRAETPGTSPSVGGYGGVGSPGVRVQRLIGDVDGVCVVGGVEVGGRVGVGAGGGVGLYTYGGSEALVMLDEGCVRVEKGDVGMQRGLKCVDVRVGGRKGVLVGVEQAVVGSLQLLREHEH